MVTFIGVGFDKRLMGETMNIGDASHLTGVPSAQAHVPPGQVRHQHSLANRDSRLTPGILELLNPLA